MRRVLLLASAPLVLAACDYRDPLDPSLACEALDVQLVDRSVAAPANVSALVRVTDCRGRPLAHTLEAPAFELSEDGRPLSFLEANRMIIPAERQMAERTLVLLDLSGSVLRSGLRPAMIAGAEIIARGASETRRVAIFGFDGRAELIPFTYFTSDQVELAAALERAESAMLVDDSTNLNGAIVAGLALLDDAVAADARDIYSVAHGSLVVFTDGEDLAGRVGEGVLGDALAVTPHATFAIGVGQAAEEGALSRLGRSGAFPAGDAEGVARAFASVEAELSARARANYVVSYCSPSRAGARTLQITVRDGGLEGTATMAFDASGFGAGCSPEGSPLR